MGYNTSIIFNSRSNYGSIFSPLKMAKSIINCACEIEFDSLAEYEALDEVYKMLNKKNPIGNKVSLIVKEIVTSSTEGCGITYPKSEQKNAK